MEQKLKLPAQCAAIPQEELEYVYGGAPAWFENTVTAVKDTLRPAKPYFQFAWELLMTGMACLSVAADMYGYMKIIVYSLDGIQETLKNFK